jgi:asparagine synthase (glutamine-hydrolysing)
MCGLVGVVNISNRPASETIIKQMNDSIVHRGPDAEGVFVHDNIGLGHRRLSIIDLSASGNQPMYSDDQNFVIVFNGEIYNYKSIRTELELLGYRFRTSTDTEVLLKSYIHWGEGCISKFNGMFAFAILNKSNKTLFLGRDRYGIKPLYYYLDKDVFVFASEIKAIHASGLVKKKLDHKGLLQYMTFQNFLNSDTLYEKVKLFDAGCYSLLNLNKISEVKLERYWDFKFSEDLTLRKEDCLEHLEFLIQQAVNRQLVSDVEIGSYLSGGMDSGSITALSARQLPFIKTFTVGFDMSSASGLELSYDERAKAEHMSYLFKTEHYEMVLKSGDMERCFNKLVHHLEEPRVGQSYPNFYASKLASKFTKVVLSGTGGDEIFGGYPWRYYRAVGHKNFEAYIDEYYNYWQRLVPNTYLKKMFAPIWNDVSSVWTRDIFRDVYANHDNELTTPESYINHSLYFEAKTFLHGLLVVEDKLSMAHSLETRVPMLDNDLVDFAMKIPVKYKINQLSNVLKMNENRIGNKADNYFSQTNDGKLIFREVMSRFIPDEITGRVKQGFSAPDASWFKGESIDFVKRILKNKHSPIYSYLDYGTVNELLDDHLEGKENRRLFVWSLLNVAQVIENLEG